MRCPKCRLITYEGRKKCPRCGEDLSPLSETLGPFYEPNLPNMVKNISFFICPINFLRDVDVLFLL